MGQQIAQILDSKNYFFLNMLSSWDKVPTLANDKSESHVEKQGICRSARIALNKAIDKQIPC